MPRTCGGQKKVSGPLKLELQIFVSCHVSAGKLTWVLCKSCTSSNQEALSPVSVFLSQPKYSPSGVAADDYLLQYRLCKMELDGTISRVQTFLSAQEIESFIHTILYIEECISYIMFVYAAQGTDLTHGVTGKNMKKKTQGKTQQLMFVELTLC